MKKQILKFGLAVLSLGGFQSCLQDVKLPVEEKMSTDDFEIQASDGARQASTIKVMNLSKKWWRTPTGAHSANVDVNGDRKSDLSIGGGGTFSRQRFQQSDVLTAPIRPWENSEVSSLQLNDIVGPTPVLNSDWWLSYLNEKSATIPYYIGNQYYGFRVKLPNGNVHYGWMLVDNKNSENGTILKIGIERVAGKAIAVGAI